MYSSISQATICSPQRLQLHYLTRYNLGLQQCFIKDLQQNEGSKIHTHIKVKYCQSQQEIYTFFSAKKQHWVFGSFIQEFLTCHHLIKVKTSKSHSNKLQLLYLYQCVSDNVIQEGGGIAAGKSLAVYGTEAILTEQKIEFHRQKLCQARKHNLEDLKYDSAQG